MDSNRYGWYYGKTNMPIWILLTPGRWWAELEFHLAGNGRLFLSGRRRRSVVWHVLYTLLFYALVFAGIFFLLGGGAPVSDRQDTPVPVDGAELVPRNSSRQEVGVRSEPETMVADSPYEEVTPPLAEEAAYLENAAPDVAVENTAPATPTEKVAESSAADDLEDLY